MKIDWFAMACAICYKPAYLLEMERQLRERREFILRERAKLDALESGEGPLPGQGVDSFDNVRPADGHWPNPSDAEVKS
jgi:hypothetical protein